MTTADLKARCHKVLEAIVLAHAEMGVPVGSEFLGQRYPFGVSPATIRNVMAELEGQGLITHPHTSAGRVPTDRGYRYYVDLLMQRGRLMPEEEQRIEGLRETETEEPEGVLAEASRLLASLTEEAGVALVPQLAHGSFRRVQLIQVGPGQIVGVVISSEGMVRHARVELAGEMEPRDLEELEDLLNGELEGVPLSQACAYLEKRLTRLGAGEEERWRGLLDMGRLGALFEDEADVILEGTSRILEAPEFQDMERTRRLMRALDNRREIVQILEKDLLADEVKLHIGAENRGTSLTDCAIAAAPYRLRGGVMGVIGVLGPTRMNYPRVTAIVGRMGQTISRIFREGGAW